MLGAEYTRRDRLSPSLSITIVISSFDARSARLSAGNAYVYGLDLISKANGSAQEYYLTDGLGSTTGITDGGGTVTGSYTYDVFGAVRSQSGATTEWSYTGEQNDPTGLEYLRARYYDNTTGRFASRDPLTLPHRYSYVGSNPASLTDPAGLCGLRSLSEFLDCRDWRGAIDPLIDRLPEGKIVPIAHPTVSYQLAATCLLYRDACEAATAAAVAAELWTYYYYDTWDPPEGRVGGPPKEGDTFIHCYWSGLITLQVGPHKAERVTTRFEAYGSDNPPEERQYDIENNRRGREYAQHLGPAAEPLLRDYCRGG